MFAATAICRPGQHHAWHETVALAQVGNVCFIDDGQGLTSGQVTVQIPLLTSTTA